MINDFLLLTLKKKHTIRATADGIVKSINFKESDTFMMVPGTGGNSDPIIVALQ